MDTWDFTMSMFKLHKDLYSVHEVFMYIACLHGAASFTHF